MWSRTQEFDLPVHTTSCMQLVLDKDFYESVAIKILAYSWWASSVCTVFFFLSHVVILFISNSDMRILSQRKNTLENQHCHWNSCKNPLFQRIQYVLRGSLNFYRLQTVNWSIWIQHYCKNRWNSVKLFVEIFDNKDAARDDKRSIIE